MYKSNIEICIVITNEVAIEIKETIGEALVNATYKVNRYQTIEEFRSWYEGHPLEVCLITNESLNSQSYKELKKKYHQLKDIALVEPSDEISTVAEHNVYIDSKNGEINLKELLQVLEFEVGQLEILMSDNEIGEDDESEVDDTYLQSTSIISIDEVEELQTDPPLAGEKRNKNRSGLKESPDTNKKINKQLDHESAAATVKEDITELEVEIKEPIGEAAPKNDVKSPLQNSPFPMRLRNIQKSLSGLKMEKNKAIGIWSPLHAAGVTSFSINFSLFLSENKVHSAVLESLTSNYMLKDWLKRYSPMPEKWVSLATNLHANEPVGDSEWIYRGVKFFPLDKEGVKQNWSFESFRTYHRMTEIYDVTLIDMPTGEMDVFSKGALQYMDELWVLGDDRVQELNSWRDYIQGIKDTHNISVHIIHNKVISASMPNKMSEVLGLPMLATIPALWEETAKNYYQKNPLYLQKKVQPILEPHYHQLATHLIGSSFKLQDKKPSMWERIAKIGRF